MIKAFLRAAQEGRPVYLHTVRTAFQSAPGACSVPLRLSLTEENQFYETRLLLPPPAGPEETAFLRRYVLARIYNILSTFGGRTLTLYLDPGPTFLPEVFRDLSAAFCIGLPRVERTGYGKCINVADRMNQALGCGSFSFRFAALSEYAPLPPAPERPARDVPGAFRHAVSAVSGRILCGIDVGGTDIKACLSADGSLVRFKEYDWNPAGFSSAQRTIAPILLLTRFLRDDYALTLREQEGPDETGRVAALRAETDEALRREAPDVAMLFCCEKIEALLGDERVNLLDGIGLSYPDVVVKNLLVGGETPKTAGLRANPSIDYESEFAKLTGLCERLSSLCREGGKVRCVNDGPMAAYTAAVELAEEAPAQIRGGVFAHTLGTELGTGWIDENGEIPEIPLEVYNEIIDLGSDPEGRYPAEDVRSTRNLNTDLPGTLQKYVGQNGVFRLAAKYLPDACPALYASLFEKGFLLREGDAIRVPAAPQDMRKPLLAFLMDLTSEPDCPEAVRQIFRDVGEFLAAAILETQELLHPKTSERMLFGRMVKHPACFALLQEGARSVTDRISLTAADDTLARTPLMRDLAADPVYTVAQFAQAVGAVYFATGLF